MKKFLKIFIPVVAILGGLALAICYMVIPQETKSAADIVVGYLNTPLGIAGGTTLTVGVVAGTIIKVIYDRYKNDIRGDIAEAKKYCEAQKKQATEKYENTLKEKEEIKTILSSYDTQIDNLVAQVVELCNTIPNAKVNALGERVKNGCSVLKQELKDNLNRLDNEFESVMEEKINIQALEEKVNLLTEKLEGMVSQYGKQEPNN